jgi:hypothetical protein
MPRGARRDRDRPHISTARKFGIHSEIQPFSQD